MRQLNGCIATGLAFSDIDKDGLLDVKESKAALRQFHKAMKGTKAKLTVIDIPYRNNFSTKKL